MLGNGLVASFMYRYAQIVSNACVNTVHVVLSLETIQITDKSLVHTPIAVCEPQTRQNLHAPSSSP